MAWLVWEGSPAQEVAATLRRMPGTPAWPRRSCRPSLDDEAWHGVSNVLADFAALPGARQYFTDRGHWYAPSFVRYLRTEAGLEAMPTRTSLTATSYIADKPGDGAL